MEKEMAFRDNWTSMKANPLPLALLSNDSSIYSDCSSFAYSNTFQKGFVNSKSLICLR